MDWVEQSFSEVVHHCEGKIVFPRTTVGQSMAVIAGADLVVCNDSAPLHLAVGLDRPTVSLFGPTDPAAVGPYDWSPRDTRHLVLRPSEAQGQTYQYRRHRDDDTLIRKLSMERVRAAVLEQLTIKPTD
jgi:ADP-heptose:LPS heptosyltransferase